MHWRHLRGKRGVLSAALAMLMAISGCDVGRAPTRPTDVTMTPPLLPTLGVAVSTEPAVVAWRCFVATPFPSAECASSAVQVSRGLVIGTAVSAPSSPTALAAVVSDRTVRLTWLAPAGGDPPASYVIEAGSAPGLADIASVDLGSAAVSLRVDDVPEGTYFVRVRAKNAAGTSGPSNEVAVTVTGGPTLCVTAPAAPTGLAATVTDLSVRLSWAAPPGACEATGYIVDVGSASGLSDVASFNTGSTATSFSAEAVSPGTFFVRVRAVNGVGISGPSNEIRFTVETVTRPCVVPSAPTSVAASVTGTTVRLSWAAGSGAPTSYVVELGTAPGASNVAVTDTGSAATSISTTLAPGTYFARLRAVNACGTGAASAEVSFRIDQPACQVPAAPSSLAASVSGTSVALSWSAPAGEPTSYVVEVGSAPGESDVSSSDTGSSSTSVTTTFTPATYYVRVRAKNACGTGNPSNEVTVTVVAQTTTITIGASGVSPKNLTVNAGTRVTFVNSDRISHDMASDPHPEHTDCPEINQVGFLVPGQSRQTGNLNTIRVCGYHDHDQPTNTSLHGTITIR